MALRQKSKLYVRCEVLKLHNDGDGVARMAKNQHPCLRRTVKTYEVHNDPASPKWLLTKQMLRLAFLGKDLLQTLNPDYDGWCPIDLGINLGLPGSYIAIPSTAWIKDADIRRMYGTHNLIIIPEDCGDDEFEGEPPLDIDRVGAALNFDVKAPVLAESKSGLILPSNQWYIDYLIIQIKISLLQMTRKPIIQTFSSLVLMILPLHSLKVLSNK